LAFQVIRLRYLMIAFAATFLLPMLIVAPGGADGAVVIIDPKTLIASPLNITVEDTLSVEVEALFFDSVPDKVLLKYSLCTEKQCGLDIPVEMTRVPATDRWTVTIGPFPAKDALGDPIADVKFYVEARGLATDGEADPVERTEVRTIDFELPPDPKNGDDGKKTPLGAEVLLAPVLLAALVVSRKAIKG